MSIADLIDIIYKTLNNPVTKDSIHTSVFIFFVTTGFMEFSKVKVSPWSWCLKKIGKIMNSDLNDKIEKLEERQEKLEERQEKMEHLQDLKEAKGARRRILRTNDDILNNLPHSKEYYDDALNDIKDYEEYCQQHDNPCDEWYFRNEKCNESIANIRRAYRESESNGDFKTQLV